MDKKFYLVNENLSCPDCKLGEVVLLGGNNDIGYAVKCSNCGKITMEDDLEEKEEDNENTIS